LTLNKFITASTHFFVEVGFIALDVAYGSDVIVSCRTTSPEILPSLYSSVSNYVINFAIVFIIVKYNFNMLHAFKYYIKFCKYYLSA